MMRYLFSGSIEAPTIFVKVPQVHLTNLDVSRVLINYLCPRPTSCMRDLVRRMKSSVIPYISNGKLR